MRSTSADPTVEVIEVDLALSVETSLSVQPAPNARDMEPGLLTVPPRVDAKPVEMIARSAVQLGNEGSAVAQMMSAPSQASGIDSPRPVEQIAKAMSVLQVSDVSTNQTVGTRSAITIQLAPHHLGQVAMTMRQVGDVVEVRIVAETTSGLAALQSDENALKQVLRTLPVEQIRLDLSLRDDGSGANLSRNDQVGEQSRSNSGFSGERNEGRDRSRLISNSYDEAVVQSSSGSELNREPQSGSQTLV
ncbi:flagellar hook-length control protein FliK [Ahrensia sp. R2A130]|uniref:flagellar hook-length control protein FliK n=1 Tax=Ahrensia sp. R2A130 TaxID=744979 RepID=UPI0018DE4E7E|nr:flagellar hook-length control protein FliK [Ahrensia sp. R2A130]